MDPSPIMRSSFYYILAILVCWAAERGEKHEERRVLISICVFPQHTPLHDGLRLVLGAEKATSSMALCQLRWGRVSVAAIGLQVVGIL